MTIEPIAVFRSPFTSKFGIPRQSGIVSGLRGTVVFTDGYRQAEALPLLGLIERNNVIIENLTF